MFLFSLGISHQTAPVEVREQVAFGPERLNSALQELTRLTSVSEAVILSTCNRTELFCGLHEYDPQPVLNWLDQNRAAVDIDLSPYLNQYDGLGAARHAFRIASGLDSMVLGEPQILGQVKQAYRASDEAKTLGKLLNHLFQRCFSVAKRVRTDTAIGHNPISVAYAAVQMCRQVFANLERHTVLLIGAGETIELCARHLRARNVTRFIVANRSLDRAQQLVKITGGEAIQLGELPTRLAEADIIISSTASPLPILGKGAMEQAIRQRKHRPIFIADLAVPRDVEPEVAALDDIYLYSVDDLHQVVAQNIQGREAAQESAELIIDQEVEAFSGWLNAQRATPLIQTYRKQIEQTRSAELERARRALAAGHPPAEVLENLARGLTNKLAHSPTHQLTLAAETGATDLLAAAEILLQLNPDENPDR
ncbi:MAG: glutamyl-tRNA reductase [Gammaproteobacteria bacterium]|nr:glutamyl-tRNA reductase [Gammaproteobacteria bacterium]